MALGILCHPMCCHFPQDSCCLRSHFLQGKAVNNKFIEESRTRDSYSRDNLSHAANKPLEVGIPKVLLCSGIDITQNHFPTYLFVGNDSVKATHGSYPAVRQSC